MGYRAPALLSLLTLLPAAFAACDAEESPCVTVAVTGIQTVRMGKTTRLSATTVDGTDPSYTWTSSRADVASVSADGTVTGVAIGQATISATGNESGASGSIEVFVTSEVPAYDKWLASAHADRNAPAFTYWSTQSPPEIPTACARCHSTAGFRDFLGADGSSAGTVEQAAPAGLVIECTACHNSATQKLTQVTFPSGAKLDELGPEARCMTCHQGRASTAALDELLTKAGITNVDLVSSKLSSLDVHNYPAGATINGTGVRPGYQYAGKSYDARFRHARAQDTCVDCHDPHSLEVDPLACGACHTAVTSRGDVRKIRAYASAGRDYDGDGDTTEGISSEVEGLQALLLKAIQTYAQEKGLGRVCYDKKTQPHWFVDKDGDGTCSATEATAVNRHVRWTARALKAIYNYELARHDPGAFAHNAKYVLQLMRDSVEDLNLALTTKVDISTTVRDDLGHFDGSAKAARYWDKDGAVPATCSRCHGGSDGLRFYVKHQVAIATDELANGVDCGACHESYGTKATLLAVESVTYPGGLTLASRGRAANLCASCHSGLESMATIDAKIKSGKLSAGNVHRQPVAALRKGTQVKLGYQYPGKTYAGEWTSHAGDGDCLYCHDARATKHTFRVADLFASRCKGCHPSASGVQSIRGAKHASDYDGDGSATEKLGDEIATLGAKLLTTIRSVAAAGGSKICFGSPSPFWFKDTDGDGVCSTTEAKAPNAFRAWTAALLKATHNYQLSQSDLGAWAHNFNYVAQLLIDSIADLGGDVSKYVRP